MRYIIWLLTVLVIESSAVHWKYDVKDALKQTVDQNNRTKASVDIKVIDYFIAKITPYARQYPPRFNDDKEKEDIRKKLYQLSMILDVLVRNEPDNIALLERAAFVNNMAHNTDIKGSHQKAAHYYERSLSIDPESQKMNYLYGMFLANTERTPHKSIIYLEKALKLGNGDARFTLGLLYVRQGKIEKGLKMLESYEKEHPDNQHVKKIIRAVKEKRLTFKTK